MKILIITASFPPQNTIAASRPYSWAKYWSRAGYDVMVLTIPKEPPTNNSPMPFDGFKVLEVPIPGIQTMRRLAGGGSSSLYWSQPTDPKENPSFKLGFKQFLRQMTGGLQQRYGIGYSCRMPDPMDLWVGKAYRAVCNESWDLVVSTAWPYCVHAPAYRLRKAGMTKRWIADWRDLWIDNHIYPGLPLFRSIERWLERRWCKAADYLTTVSEPLAEILRSKYGDKVAVIYNGFDPEDYTNLPSERAFPDDGVFRLVYTGTIYKGKQDPSPLFAAVKQMTLENRLTPRQLQILFCGYNADVNDLATAHGVSAYVQYLGLVPRTKALHMQRDAGALLFLEFESETVKGILTGKLFEYLYAGPPILAVGIGADSSVGTMLKETGRGVAYGKDVERLALALERLCSNTPERISVPTGDLRQVMQYTREAQAGALINNVIQMP